MRLKVSLLLSLPFAIIYILSLLTLLSETTHAEDLPASASEIECVHRISPWENGAAAPSNHIEGAAALINDKLYIVSGFDSYDTTLHTSTVTDVYNPATNIWESVDEPRNETPPGRSHIQGAADGQYLWFAGGYVGSHPGPPTREVWRYDTINDEWWQGPNLPERRASAGLVVVGRELHFLGGLSADRQTDYGDHWVLNLDNPDKWQVEPALPRPRNHFQAVAIGHIIYVVAGVTGHDGPHSDRPWLDAYDTITNTWTILADMPKGRSHAEMGTFVLDNRIIIAGGRSEGTVSPDEGQVDRITEYDPETNTWYQIGTLPKNLISPLVFAHDGKIFASLGGVAWNIPQKSTWIANIVMDCGYAPGNPDPAGGIYRVNAGGSALFLNGSTWDEDSHYNGGVAKTFQKPDIAGTENDVLYITERSSNNDDATFSYDFSVDPGMYEVRLHFAEIYWEQTNQRIFDVLIEGQTVLDEYDIVADVGANTAVIKTFSNINVTDDTLNIVFPPATKDKPKISAIEIYLSTCVENPTICQSKPQAVDDAVQVNAGSSIDIAVLSNDLGEGLNLLNYTNPTQGSLEVINTNVIRYTHDGSEVLTDSFTYTIVDALNRQSTGSVSIVIIPANKAPTAEDDAIVVDKGGTATTLKSGATSVLENDSDPEENALTAEVAELPGHGSLILNSDGTFIYTHDGSETTSDSFKYTVMDDQGGEAIGNVSIQINAVPDGETPPGNPEVIYLVNEGEIFPTFTWIPNSNTTNGFYHLVVIRDGTVVIDLWMAAADVCEDSDCAFTPDDTLILGGFINGNYTWWIGAWNGETNNTDWSEGNSFEVAVPAPHLTGTEVNPRQGRPIIRWVNDPNMTWFHIYIGNAHTMSFFNWISRHEITCNEQHCWYKPDINPLAGDYSVWIRGWGPGGFTEGIEGGWQGPIIFTLPDEIPELVTGLTFTVSNPMTFTWVPSERATWYQIWVGTPAPEWQTAHMAWYVLDDLDCDSGMCSVGLASLPSDLLVWYVRAWGPGGFTQSTELDGWTQGKAIPKR